MAGVSLLILDDDSLIGETITRIAETAGIAARYTTEPGEFFELLRIWEPTHIALDLVMPAMDGMEVLARLAESDCRARIILTSGMSSRVLGAATRSARERGLSVAGVLQKPFSAGALRELIQNAEAEYAPSVAPSSEERQSAQITVIELERAIAEHELRVYYQPKIECRTGRIAGVEALARWMHPEHGIVMPDAFIPFAEANRLMGSLTLEILDQALDSFSRSPPIFIPGGPPVPGTSESGMEQFQLSVNISPQNLDDGSFVEAVTRQCAKYGVAPSRLILELTETCAMEDPVKSLAALTRLRMKGFHLAIDDFGTGFSSMLQLVRLPFSEIKIDKSFVIKATVFSESRTVVKSIIDLGHSLGLITTAEGVDDQGTLDFLTAVGCDLAQGYLIGRPAPGGRLAAGYTGAGSGT